MGPSILLPRPKTPATRMAMPGGQPRNPEAETPIMQTIDHQLARRRRRSYPKACYPCRSRKVRCNNLFPCGNCLKSEHPELCVYLDQNGDLRRQRASTASRASATSTSDRVAALADLERRMQAMAEEVVRRLGSFGGGMHRLSPKQRQPDEGSAMDLYLSQETPQRLTELPGHPQPEDVAAGDVGVSLHIGAASLASILVDTLKSGHPLEDSPQDSDDIGLSLPSAAETMKLLHMTDRGSTHPFTNLWKPGATVEEICLALPDNETFERYMNSFQQSVNLISPSIPLQDFAVDARDFWRERSKGEKRESELRSTAWLALLFCVLASGCSHSGTDRTDDDLSSRVFVCCTSELLRLDNYLLHPTIDNVLVLTGLAGVLRVQANPAASWSLLGMTIRAAQSIGIHRVPPPTVNSTLMERQSWLIWQGLVWQDTTLSLCYDRPPAAFVDGSVRRIPRPSESGGYPYLESCFGLAMIMNDIYHDWTHSRRAGLGTLSPVRFQVATEQILLWEASAEEYLRHRANCKDSDQRVLHDVFQIFVNFFVFQLHRHHLTAPSLFGNNPRSTASSPVTAWGTSEITEAQNLVCMDRCEIILRRFMSLRRENPQASHLWILMHICFGSALYLASELKKHHTREREAEFSAQDKAQIRHQLLCDLATDFEQSLPNMMHTHHVDFLQALKHILKI